MASFSNLPSEVVVLIAEACRTPEKSALARGNRHLNELLTPALYRYNIQRDGGSAMFWAARHGRVETLERLVSFGAEVNDNTASRWPAVHRPYYPYRRNGPRRLHDTFFTPLHIAAKFGQDNAVKWLLNHGARIEAMAHNLCACQEGVIDVANDNDFDPRLSPLVTPIHIAMCNGKLGTAKLLVSRGAQVDVGVSTPLHTAARLNNAGAISFLLERDLLLVDEPDTHGYTPLHLACMEFEDLSTMEKLLEFGANVEMQADDGRTPLAFACERGYFKAAIRLLGHGADPEVEWDGQTPIQAAALSMQQFFPHESPPDPATWEDEREELVRRLVELGVDVDEVGGLGTTALHIAAGQESLARTIQCFLDAGADVNAPDNIQQTPLHVAFESGDLTSIVVKIVPLLQRGSRIDTLCIRGRSALESALGIARMRDDYSIIDTIFQHTTTADSTAPFLGQVVGRSYIHGLWEECRVLIRHGAVLNLCDDELEVRFRGCIDDKDVLHMRFLLDTFPGRVTPRRGLAIALRAYSDVKEQDVAIIIALLDRPDMDVGARVSGIEDASPLIMACNHHHGPGIIQRLLDMGSEVNVFDDDYNTPLTHATRNRCSQTVSLLLRYGADPFMTPTKEDWRAYVEGRDEDWYNNEYSYNAFFPAEVKAHRTAFHMAIESHDEFGPGLGSCPHDPTGSRTLEIILEHRSLPPLPTDPSLYSYLHFALEHPEGLDILLKRGADPNGGGHCDKPPLMAAVRYLLNPVKVVAILLRSGADINQRDDEGESFLEFLKAATTRVQGINEDAEFKTQKLFSDATLVRHFRIVIDADSGEERIEARPDNEVRAAHESLDRRRKRAPFRDLDTEGAGG